MTSNPTAESAIPGVPHRWTALTIALTAIGFIVFWPLGLAMIAYVLWGEKIAASCRDSGDGFARFRQAADDFGRKMRTEFSARGPAAGGWSATGTGNAAFDAWRAAELERLAAERRRIDETTAAFEAHLRQERGGVDEARQREEFERFMAARGGR